MRLLRLSLPLLASALLAPVQGQTNSQNLTQLDLIFVMDQSSSISAADKSCVNATGTTCWALAGAYFASITETMRALTGGWAPVDAQTGAPDATGLGMAGYTFSCRPRDGLPLSFNLTDDEFRYNEQALLGATNYLLNNLAPMGGTCPSLALDFAHALADRQPPARANQMLVLMTDGAIDPADLPATRAAAAQLNASGVSVFVVAIGYALATGWDEEAAKDIFGARAQLLRVDDFAQLGSTVAEASAAIAGAFSPGVRPSDEIWSSSDAGGDDSGATETGGATPVVAGAVLGVAIAGLAVAGVLHARRRRSAAQQSNELGAFV